MLSSQQEVFTCGSLGRDEVGGEPVLDGEPVDGGLDLAVLDHVVDVLCRRQQRHSHLYLHRLAVVGHRGRHLHLLDLSLLSPSPAAKALLDAVKHAKSVMPQAGQSLASLSLEYNRALPEVGHRAPQPVLAATLEAISVVASHEYVALAE